MNRAARNQSNVDPESLHPFSLNPPPKFGKSPFHQIITNIISHPTDEGIRPSTIEEVNRAKRHLVNHSLVKGDKSGKNRALQTLCDLKIVIIQLSGEMDRIEREFEQNTQIGERLNQEIKALEATILDPNSSDYASKFAEKTANLENKKQERRDLIAKMDSQQKAYTIYKTEETKFRKDFINIANNLLSLPFKGTFAFLRIGNVPALIYTKFRLNAILAELNDRLDSVDAKFKHFTEKARQQSAQNTPPTQPNINDFRSVTPSLAAIPTLENPVPSPERNDDTAPHIDSVSSDTEVPPTSSTFDLDANPDSDTNLADIGQSRASGGQTHFGVSDPISQEPNVPQNTPTRRVEILNAEIDDGTGQVRNSTRGDQIRSDIQRVLDEERKRLQNRDDSSSTSPDTPNVTKGRTQVEIIDVKFIRDPQANGAQVGPASGPANSVPGPIEIGM